MSVVTNLMLSGVMSTHVLVDRLNAIMEANEQGPFLQVDQHAGGRKAIETHVYMTAANYLTDTVVEQLKVAIHDFRMEQRGYHTFQLFIQTQHDNHWDQIYPVNVRLVSEP